MLNGTGMDSAHIALDSDCFSHATASTRSWTPAWTRLEATIAVAPPTDPAVCTRISGLPTAPSASARNSSGIMTPSKKSGALPTTTASMSFHSDLRVGHRPVDRLAAQARHRDVLALGLVMGLSGAENRCPVLAHERRLHDADQVLLQGRAAGGVREDLARLAGQDVRRGLADADQAAGEHRIAGERTAGGIDAHVVAQTERCAQDQFLVGERRMQLGDFDAVDCRPPAAGGSRRRGRGWSGHGRRGAPDSMRCAMPVITAGFSVSSRARSTLASTIAAAPSVIGAQSCLRSGSAKYGSASSSSTSLLPDELRLRVRLGVAPVAHRDLGHGPLGPQPGVEAEPRLQAGDADRVRPQRRDGVRVELQRERAPQQAGRGLAEAVDQRRVDLARDDLQPRLVQRPRARRPRRGTPSPGKGADRVEGGDERERPPGEVVRGARAPEADVLVAQAGLA